MPQPPPEIRDQHRALQHDSTTLHAAIRGSGPPVLFIQGVGVHGDGWLPQIDTLANRFTCLRFDNRGIGQSPRGPGALSVERMASDALAVMHAHGWDSAHIVGHSLGGVIAQRLALAHPEAARSLSLLCTVSRGRDATALTPTMLWLGLRTRIGPRRARRRAFLRLLYPPSALRTLDRDEAAARLAPLFGHDLADQPPIVMEQLRALAAFDATPDLSRLADIPTLIISAAHDPIARPCYSKSMAAAIAGSRLVELTEVSHGVPIHHPELVNRLLTEHISALESR